MLKRLVYVKLTRTNKFVAVFEDNQDIMFSPALIFEMSIGSWLHLSRGSIRLKVVGIWWSSAIRGQRRNLLPLTEVTTISATHYISILKLAHRLKDEVTKDTSLRSHVSPKHL